MVIRLSGNYIVTWVAVNLKSIETNDITSKSLNALKESKINKKIALSLFYQAHNLGQAYF